MPSISKIHDAIKAVAPIDGLSVGTFADKATWKVQFQGSATQPQKDAVAAVIAAYDVAADDAADAALKARAQTLADTARVDAFIQQLRAATPTQINSYVNANVTDLVSARNAIAHLALAIAYLLRGDPG